MTDETKSDDALKLVDVRRRSLLTKLLAGGAAAAALPAMSSVALAADGPQGAGNGGKGGKGKGGAGKGGQGKGGAGNRNPDEIAARWIEEFDGDGDGALNVRELTAALEAMAERRAAGPGAGGSEIPGGPGKGKGGAGKGGPGAGKGGPGRGKGGAGKGGAGKGKGGPGKGPARPAPGGGVRPTRPPAE